MSKKILEENPISLEEVVELLEHRDEEAPLNYIQRVTLDYARRFSKDFPRQKEFIKEIVDEFELPPEKAIQLVNISAETLDNVDLVLSRDFSKKTKENIAQHAKEHIAKYAEDSKVEEEAGGLDDF